MTTELEGGSVTTATPNNPQGSHLRPQLINGLTARLVFQSARLAHQINTLVLERLMLAGTAPVYEIYKQWVAEVDACDDCRILHGCRVRTYESFPDNLEPGEVHYNCRCRAKIGRGRIERIDVSIRRRVAALMKKSKKYRDKDGSLLPRVEERQIDMTEVDR
jgi:hypothetical protein